jgi:mRNA cleavage and polyadenylation factor CLP1 P-loop
MCLQANAAGLIINTMGWVDGLGYDLLLHSIQALEVAACPLSACDIDIFWLMAQEG